MASTEMATRRGLVLVGGGGHASVVAEAAELSGLTVLGYVAPEPSEVLANLVHLGSDQVLSELSSSGAGAIVAIGFVDRPSQQVRDMVLHEVQQSGLAQLQVVHPHAVVSPSASIEAGSFVAAGAVVSANCVVGASSIVNTGAVVDHDCLLEAGCHIATGARLAGGVQVGESALVGCGATVLQGQRVGDRALVGAGAVVVGAVAAMSTVTGIPARAVR